MKNFKKLLSASVLGLLLMSGCGSENTKLPVSLDGSGKLTPTNPVKVSKKNSRIIGGDTVYSKNTYPWMAGLIHIYDPDNIDIYTETKCGGSLIAKNWVITAAHCVDEGETPSSMRVLLDTNILDPEDDYYYYGDGTVVEIKRIIMHPNYNNDTLDSDIALIELKKKVSYPKLTVTTSNDNLVGKMVTAIGWGYTKPNGYKSIGLQHVELPVVSNNVCTYDMTSNMFCAGYENGYKSIASGDSGGPIVVDRNGRWELVGITSFNTKNKIYYGGFTKVANFRNFISKYVNNQNNYDNYNNNNYNQNNNYNNNYNQSNSLQVFDFYQKNSNGVYKASCYKKDWIINGEFKLKNNGSNAVYIDKLALAVHRTDGSFLFNISYTDIPSYNEKLNSGQYFQLNKNSGWIMDTGSYKLIAKAYYNNSWHNLQTKNFVVQKNYSCSYNNNNNNYSTTKNADYYIDKFHSAYPNFFGYSQGNKYTCYTNYRCQNFSSGHTIAVDKNTYDMSWWDNDEWNYHGIGPEIY